MNIADAAYKTVHDYPGGSESLAPRIGMSPAVLRNKVNPNNSTHHLTLAEADTIMGVVGDHSVLHALAAQHGYVLMSVDAPAQGTTLIGSVLAASAGNGDLSEVIAEALSDGKVTPNEAQMISRLCGRLQSVFAQVAAHANAAAGRVS